LKIGFVRTKSSMQISRTKMPKYAQPMKTTKRTQNGNSEPSQTNAPATPGPGASYIIKHAS
jgi:hypothetical protein